MDVSVIIVSYNTCDLLKEMYMFYIRKNKRCEL